MEDDHLFKEICIQARGRKNVWIGSICNKLKLRAIGLLSYLRVQSQRPTCVLKAWLLYLTTSNPSVHAWRWNKECKKKRSCMNAIVWLVVVVVVVAAPVAIFFIHPFLSTCSSRVGVAPPSRRAQRATTLGSGLHYRSLSHAPPLQEFASPLRPWVWYQ